MKFLKQLCIVTFILLIQNSNAQLKSVIGKTTYPFWINTTAEKTDEKVPILVFLHGKSLSGTNLERVKRYGVLRAMEKGRKINAIVVAPQVASGSWNPDKVLEVIEYVQKNYNTDLSRVYVCGMSLGGYGTLHFAGKYPDKITAGVAICGGGFEKDGCNLSKVPLWIQHGDKDKAVPLSESEKVVNAIKKCNPNANLKFSIKKGESHGSVEHLFHEDEMYDWMFSQTKKK